MHHDVLTSSQTNLEKSWYMMPTLKKWWRKNAYGGSPRMQCKWCSLNENSPPNRVIMLMITSHSSHKTRQHCFDFTITGKLSKIISLSSLNTFLHIYGSFSVLALSLFSSWVGKVGVWGSQSFIVQITACQLDKAGISGH